MISRRNRAGIRRCTASLRKVRLLQPALLWATLVVRGPAPGSPCREFLQGTSGRQPRPVRDVWLPSVLDFGGITDDPPAMTLAV